MRVHTYVRHHHHHAPPATYTRQANYDADAALVALLGTATTTTAASSSRGATPSPPPRPSSAFQHGGGSVASSPLPPQPPPHQHQQQEQQYAFPTALRPTAAAAAGIGDIVRSGTPEVNRSAGGIRAQTPPSTSKGGGWVGLRSPSPLQGETGMAERLSMGSPAPPQVTKGLVNSVRDVGWLGPAFLD